MGAARQVTRWKRTEREDVLNHAIKLYRELKIMPSLDNAQEILPEHRRHKGWQHEQRYKADFLARVAAEAKPDLTVLGPPPRAVEPESPSIEDFSTERIVKFIRSKFGRAVIKALVEEVRAALPQRANDDDEEAQVFEIREEDKRERIVVVGVTKHYEKALRLFFKDDPTYDVRFIRNDTPLAMIGQRVSFGDRVLFLTNWISHKAEDVTRKNLAVRAIYTRVTGNVESIVKAIRKEG